MGTQSKTVILQSESKMKAGIGKHVKVNLPKPSKQKNKQTKSLAVKRVPADITDSEFQEFLDLNKINCAKAERLKSQKKKR